MPTTRHHPTRPATAQVAGSRSRTRGARRYRMRSTQVRTARHRYVTGSLAVLLALAVALLLGACTGKKKDDGQGGGKATAPLASVRGDVTGLVLSAGSLKRDGANVTLRFTITNQGGSTVTIGDLLGKPGSANSHDTGGVTLYDGANRKRYLPSDQTPTTVPLGLDPGKSVELTTTFPDVPDSAGGDLSALVPHFAPLDGLTVQG